MKLKFITSFFAFSPPPLSVSSLTTSPLLVFSPTKRGFLLMLVFLPLLMFSPSKQAKAQDKVKLENVGLKECIDYGMKQSVTVANAKLDIAKAKADIGIIFADGLPQVSASSSFTHNFKIPIFFVPANAFNPAAPAGEVSAVQFGVPFQGTVGIGASQLLFDGTYFLGLKAATVYSELTEKIALKSEVDVVNNISKAFYTALITKQRLELVEANVKRLESLLNDTRALYKQGFVEKIDADRIEVNYNSLVIERQKMVRMLELTYTLLKFQMGMQAQDEISVKGSIQDLEAQQLNELRAALLLKEENFDYSQRIEAQILQTQITLENYNVRRFKVGYYPKLSANFSYGGNTGVLKFSDWFRFNDRWFGNGSYGLTLSIPIFDGLRRHNQIQGAKVGLLKAENTLKETKRGIDLEIKQAQISLSNALETLDAQKRNMELASEVARITKIKYKEGVGTNNEVIDAESALINAQTNYYSAFYDALIAKVDLDKAKGSLNK
jgi:outer membrane protein TolC